MTDLIEPTAVLAPETRRVPGRTTVHIVIFRWTVWAWIASLGCAAVVIALAQSVMVTFVACGVLVTLPVLAAAAVRLTDRVRGRA